MRNENLKISSISAEVSFTRGGVTVSKQMETRGGVVGLMATALQLWRLAREADRDIAFKIHGDNYRDNCEFKNSFFDTPRESELLGLFGDDHSTD